MLPCVEVAVAATVRRDIRPLVGFHPCSQRHSRYPRGPSSDCTVKPSTDALRDLGRKCTHPSRRGSAAQTCPLQKCILFAHSRPLPAPLPSPPPAPQSFGDDLCFGSSTSLKFSSACCVKELIVKLFFARLTCLYIWRVYCGKSFMFIPTLCQSEILYKCLLYIALR